MKIIYIASEPRAGSTFLQLLLATHPHVAGLGEIAQVIRRAKLAQNEGDKLPPCSCGARQENCPFWSPLLPELLDSTPQDAHRKIRAHFAQQFPGKVLIDSSKATAPLSQYYASAPASADLDVRVLYVIRDFRGWVPSVHKHRHNVANWALETTPAYLVPTVKQFRRERHSLKFGYVQDSYRWMLRTRGALDFLAKSGLPHLIVSYEELVFNLEKQARRIGNFLGMSFEHDLSDLSRATAHELYGSPILKTSAVKRSRISYDHSWLSDSRSALLSPLLLPVHAFNSHVYRDLAESPPRNLKRALPPFQADFAVQLRTGAGK